MDSEEGLSGAFSSDEGESMEIEVASTSVRCIWNPLRDLPALDACVAVADGATRRRRDTAESFMANDDVEY